MMFVVADIWGVKVSPEIIIGIPLTKTVALDGLTAVNGINGVGGQKQVRFLTIIPSVLGGLLHGCCV
jgi:hypothetical protein